ncbi:YgdB family protein [Xenorhabdus lircayensis]|uniref:YgdB family protein n=1 Tax=Xenorhabdus lircayensis TaxID=2763499 RepID=A0ABS0U4Q8_9GAMM|nr:YgdB family protein [Xenorhabdus lircayensis]MBI6548867.1 YgdB family protein [Xenorhabdus lircayensis]
MAEKRVADKQQGNILLVSIIMLLALSLMMLKALHYQQENAMLMMMDEQNYLKAFLRAESSLTWGKVQSWQINQQEMDGWFCLQQTEFHLKSCLKRYSDNLFLLKGIAQFTSGENLELYQWMKLMKNLNQDTLISIALTPVESGWLDFCPVPQAEFCL